MRVGQGNQISCRLSISNVVNVKGIIRVNLCVCYKTHTDDLRACESTRLRIFYVWTISYFMHACENTRYSVMWFLERWPQTLVQFVLPWNSLLHMLPTSFAPLKRKAGLNRRYQTICTRLHLVTTTRSCIWLNSRT